MKFQLLGPVVVRNAELSVRLGGPRQRSVLAALVIRANEQASTRYLTEAVWEEAPASPETNLRTYVAGLRRCFSDAGLDPSCLVTNAGGYLLRVEPLAVDVRCFDNLADAGDQALQRGDAAEAARLFATARQLWRGTALEGLEVGLPLRAELIRWENRRLAVLEQHARAAVQLGLYDSAIADLQALVAQHPLREPLWAQLMVAMCRSGRHAEALATYHTARSALAAELGVDPGPELRDLYERILADDREPTRPHSSADEPTDRPSVPRQLPTPPAWFVGRANEFAQLDELIRQSPNVTPISVICGMGGVGKTWLALHWAHHRADQFRDGQLHVRLRGFEAAAEPTSPETAVRAFLDALGVPANRIPDDLDAQTALYRSLVAERRMLIVLDDARNTDQVIPLLPGTHTCAVLITTRGQLTGLLANYDTRQITLDVLEPADAHRLLTRAITPARVAAETDAIDALLNYCAGLPLALAVTAAYTTLHPAFPLSGLAHEMRDTSDQPAGWDNGELANNLSMVFSSSYALLDRRAATTFALLGLVSGPDISAPAAAALTGLTTGQIRVQLRSLEAGHLVVQHSPGRYQMHDLVRQYAAEQARGDLPAPAVEQALRRLVDFYLYTAIQGDLVLNPHRAPIRTAIPSDGCIPEQLVDSATAIAWFRNEHADIIAVHRLAAERGWHSPVWQLAWALSGFHGWSGHRHDDVAVWQAGLVASEHLNDPQIQALARRFLGRAYNRVGNVSAALENLCSALTLLEATNDLFGQAHTHRQLAVVRTEQGEHQQALAHAARALDLYRSVGAPTWEAEAYNLLGWQHALAGNYQQAQSCCARALVMSRRNHNRESEGHTLHSLGYIALRTGQPAEAIRYYQLAHTVVHDLGNTAMEADVSDCLGDAHAAVDQVPEAVRAWENAARMYRTQYRTENADRTARKLIESRACTTPRVQSVP